MQFNIQHNHLRGLRRRKWHFFSDSSWWVPQYFQSKSLLRADQLHPKSMKVEGLSLAYCLPPSLAISTSHLQAHTAVLSAATFISIPLLLLKGEGPWSWETEYGCSLLHALGRTSCYHAATLVAWDNVARPPKENFGLDIAEELRVGPLLQNFCHL